MGGLFFKEQKIIANIKIVQLLGKNTSKRIERTFMKTSEKVEYKAKQKKEKKWRIRQKETQAWGQSSKQSFHREWKNNGMKKIIKLIQESFKN